MTIWGYTHVHVIKDSEKREWRVCTPDTKQLLCTVPWTDAFKTFKHAPDYSEAIATCQAHERTSLTLEEENSIIAELEQLAAGVSAPAKQEEAKKAVQEASNVIPLRRKKP